MGWGGVGHVIHSGHLRDQWRFQTLGWGGGWVGWGGVGRVIHSGHLHV